MKIRFLLVLLIVAIGISGQVKGRDTVFRVDNLPAAVAASNKAYDLAKKGDLDGAIRFYDTAINLDPKMYLSIYARGTLFMLQKKWERAIADFGAALAVSPSFYIAAIKRAEVNERLGRYDKALADLDRVINLQPMQVLRAAAKSDRAWLLATSSNPAFRDGKRAVADAKAACNIDAWDNWNYIDTLAAAYAETGDFDNAIKFEQKAISKTREAANIKDAQQRLALYQQHRPVRDVTQ